MTDTDLKCCTECIRFLPRTAFDPHPTGRDGLRSKCRGCRAEAARTARATRKKCGHCQRYLSLHRYPANPRRQDGRGALCNDCHNAMAAAMRAKVLSLGLTPRETDPAPPDPVEIGLAWQKRAACKDEDPELFYAGRGEDAADQAEEAMAVCDGCPVARQCHADGIASGRRFGIWGGANLEPRTRQKQPA